MSDPQWDVSWWNENKTQNHLDTLFNVLDKRGDGNPSRLSRLAASVGLVRKTSRCACVVFRLWAHRDQFHSLHCLQNELRGVGQTRGDASNRALLMKTHHRDVDEALCSSACWVRPNKYCWTRCRTLFGLAVSWTCFGDYLAHGLCSAGIVCKTISK